MEYVCLLGSRKFSFADLAERNLCFGLKCRRQWRDTSSDLLKLVIAPEIADFRMAFQSQSRRETFPGCTWYRLSAATKSFSVVVGGNPMFTGVRVARETVALNLEALVAFNVEIDRHREQ